MSKTIHEHLSKILLFIICVNVQNAFGQLSGTKSIPGDFLTVSAAVSALNAQGVGVGGVIFNVADGYAENTTAPIILTATGNFTDRIIFQKNGSGMHPLITRNDSGSFTTAIEGGQGDGIIIIEGSDYVTFDGIDVASLNEGIEYGYYIRKTSGTNGCSNVTIKNCKIDLTKGTSPFVTGIYSSNNDANSSVDSNVGVFVTSISGRHENITLTGNTIQDVFIGIICRGFSAIASQFDYLDQNITIGAEGAGNLIQNFAGYADFDSYGVVMYFQANHRVVYNTINNVAGGGTDAIGDIYGVYFPNTMAGGDMEISNNNITLGQASTKQLYCIANEQRGNSLQINNNTFSIGTFNSTSSILGSVFIACSNSALLDVTIRGNKNVGVIKQTGQGPFMGISCHNGNNNALISDNEFTNIQLNGDSQFWGIYYNCFSDQPVIISGNDISNVSGTSNIIYGIYATNLGTPSFIYDNSVNNLSGTGNRVIAMYIGSFDYSSGMIETYNNTVYNLTGNNFVYGIRHQGGNGSVFNTYNNNIYNISGAFEGSLAAGMMINYGGTFNIYNNFISDIKAPIAVNDNAVQGIGIDRQSSNPYTFGTVGLYYNTIYLNASSSGINFGSSGIYHTYYSSSSYGALDMRNNIVVNTSAANGTGKTVAFRRSGSSDLNNYKSVSNNNAFYAGIPSTSNLIYYDSTNSDQTITSFQSRVAPRESFSFSENPPFLNIASPPYDLHLNHTLPTLCESGGKPITTPLFIETDYDFQLRDATKPDVGADEFQGTVPVELISFTSNLKGNDVTLLWTTATEKNNMGFEVQRKIFGTQSSVSKWETIGFINGGGTTTQMQNYSFVDKNVFCGSYQYRLKQIDYDGSFEYFNAIEVEVKQPAEFMLFQNYPNPFNPITKISWQSPIDAWQILKIFDVLGNEVAVLVNEFRPAGIYEVEFNTSIEPEYRYKNLASGIYFYQLKVGEQTQTKKMLLSK